MAKKTCPNCGAEWGPRKKVCDCGHDFGVKIASKRYPEPGSWVDDNMKGFEPIEVPEKPYNGEQMSNAELREIVAYEGLGFCIHQYIPPGKIKSKTLQDLWRKAKKAMTAVVIEMDK